MKSTIQTSVFVLGAAFLALSYWDSTSTSMKMWFVLAAVATEGLFAHYLVRDAVRSFPGRPTWENLLPATLPLLVMAGCVFRLFRILEPMS